MEQDIRCQSIKITEIINGQDLNNESNLNEDSSHDYLVEEPLDFIFEPNHDPQYVSGYTNTNNISPQYSVSQEEKSKNGVKYLNRMARMVSESDGILEYQYTSTSDMRSTLDDDEEFFENYFNDFDYRHHHLNAIIRSISLSSYPDTQCFGFNIARHLEEDEDLFYVDKIIPNTPAELCLRLGDIIVEIDEKNPSEMFERTDQLHEYLNNKTSIHMMVIHESKYTRLKSQEQDLVKKCSIDCEDVVIVSWNNQFETSLI